MSGSSAKRKGTDLMTQMGINNMGVTLTDDTDDDLEAEFAALTGEDVPVKKSPSNKKGIKSMSEIEQMAAHGLQDISDEVSDTEDPQLLSELAELEMNGTGPEPGQGESIPKLSEPADITSKDTEPVDTIPKHLEVAESDGYSKGAELSTDTANLQPLQHASSGAHLSDTNAAMDSKGDRPESSEERSELPPDPTEEEAKRLFQAPEAPKTVMEALTQRLEKYKSSEEGARQAGDNGKARRMGRIVKQYQDAIQSYRAGKSVDFKDLPAPPGFGPIPMDSNLSEKTTSPHQDQSKSPSAAPTMMPTPVSATLASSETTASMRQSNNDCQGADGDASSGAAGKTKVSLKRESSKQEYQLQFLRERVEEFRKAALNSKRNGDLESAKQHLRAMKGIEQMIEASEAGKSVDLSQVPPLPAVDDHEDKRVVVSADYSTGPVGDRDALFTQLEQDLIIQMRMCATNSQHFTKVGNVPAASNFQKLEQTCRKDLESLKNARGRGDPVPKFHYETRNFDVIQCNTALGDGEMELVIVRGIALSLPSGFSEKDMDTSVKYEFAFPSDESQTGQTSTVKSTINPEYNESFKLQIDRKSRSFARFIERKGIKLHIYVKRGFFKGDQLLGSATVKLSPLDTQCTLHDSFDLADGRKHVGGKLEVKVRVREPFKGRQVENSQEKWLVIDQFLHTLDSKVEKPKSTKSSICALS